LRSVLRSLANRCLRAVYTATARLRQRPHARGQEQAIWARPSSAARAGLLSLAEHDIPGVSTTYRWREHKHDLATFASASIVVAELLLVAYLLKRTLTVW
jgi:hypothetical protein